jgi:hypothetical protein
MQEPWQWKIWYGRALVELDAEEGQREQCVQAARNAIIDRLEDSLHGRKPLSSAERAQIEDACRTLLLFREYSRAA